VAYFPKLLLPHAQTQGKAAYQQKYIKKYHPPKTPCQRLLESDHVCPETKNQLMAVFLNTFTRS
jgi:hypothetical protein